MATPQYLNTLAVVLACAALTACGGSNGDNSSTDATTTPSITVPGAPTIGAATAGDSSASIAFSAPSSNGGASITGYTASCTASNTTQTGTASTSPITVNGLTNDTTYSCTVTAKNSAGNSAASSAVSAKPVATTLTGTPSTVGVQCAYSYSAYNSSASVKATSTSAWSCSSTQRTVSGNGIPDHGVGTFPSTACPNTISAQTVSTSVTLTPTISSTTGTQASIVGYSLNSVKFDPNTAGACTDSGSCSLIGGSGTWQIEALGQSSFDFGVDSNNAHVQPTGEYHYHGMPEGVLTNLGKGKAMALVGFALDGYPIYARYGYSVASSAASEIKVLTGSYATKSTPDTNRPSTTTYPMGTFKQDWEYVSGSGDLDECNGRTGVTPEFPNGIYYYVITDTYPFIGRCLKGAFTASSGGGTPPSAPSSVLQKIEHFSS